MVLVALEAQAAQGTFDFIFEGITAGLFETLAQAVVFFQKFSIGVTGAHLRIHAAQLCLPIQQLFENGHALVPERAPGFERGFLW